MRTSLILLSLSALLVGCGSSKGTGTKDSDGDGLSDSDESGFGTDAAVADTDGDGLTDKEEFDGGTSGTVVDTDGDGYRDSDELTEGSDPLDASSWIYTGGWPYYADKDSLTDPGFSGGTAAGDAFPRFQWTDQFGEAVDIYDYAFQGKPIIIDLSGEWCYWCNEVAKWLEHDASALDSLKGTEWYDNLPDMVDNGEILWVTVLDADWSGGKISEAEVAEWADTYPNDKIAVLQDKDMELAGYLQPMGYPTALVLNEDMTIAKFKNSDYTKAFSTAYDMATGN